MDSLETATPDVVKEFALLVLHEVAWTLKWYRSTDNFKSDRWKNTRLQWVC
jgi:hypothetical protein